MSNEWHYGIFECKKNFLPCVVSFVVPCGSSCVQAKANSLVTNEHFCVPCGIILVSSCFEVGCVGHAINRAAIREKLEINGSFMHDVCCWIYCQPCAAMQEYNEVLRSSFVEY